MLILFCTFITVYVDAESTQIRATYCTKTTQSAKTKKSYLGQGNEISCSVRVWNSCNSPRPLLCGAGAWGKFGSSPLAELRTDWSEGSSEKTTDTCIIYIRRRCVFLSSGCSTSQPCGPGIKESDYRSLSQHPMNCVMYVGSEMLSMVWLILLMYVNKLESQRTTHAYHVT